MEQIIFNVIYIFILFFYILLLSIASNMVKFISMCLFFLLLLLHKLKNIEHYTNMENTNYVNHKYIKGSNPKTLLTPVIRTPIYASSNPITTNTYNINYHELAGNIYDDLHTNHNTSPNNSYNVENLYKKEYTNAPIQSNIGISNTYQIKPIEPIHYNHNNYNEPIYLNEVYDPRYYGYGNVSSYYKDPISSVHKFNYKNIEDIRKPKIINRTKLSVNANLNKPFRDITMNYINDTNFHRYNIQESLMRKRNAELSEYRKHPHRRDQSFKYQRY